MAENESAGALANLHDSAMKKARLAFGEFLKTNQSCYCGSHFALWMHHDAKKSDTLHEIIADWCYSTELISTEVEQEKPR